MIRNVVALLVAVLTVHLHAQGQIEMNNRLIGVVDAKMTDSNGVGLDSRFVAELALVSSWGAVTVLSPVQPFRDGDGAGYIAPPFPLITVPGVPAGQPATFILRIYLAGWTFETSPIRAQSAPFTVTLGGQPPIGVPIPPPALVGLQPLTFLSAIPPRATRDFSGDDRGDILWRHADGDIGAYNLVNGSVTGWTSLGFVPDPLWQIAGTGDFNVDGKTDLLWRHQGTGAVGAYLVSAGQVIGWKDIVTVADLNWQIAGIGDFDHDRQDDILWRHRLTGDMGAYKLLGGSVAGWIAFNSIADLDWQIAGVADLNDDGGADIVWRHRHSGEVGAYMMVGSAVNAWRHIAFITDANWQIAALLDVNHDRHTDIVWRHSGGTIGAYLMQYGVVWGWKDITNVADPAWQIAGPR